MQVAGEDQDAGAGVAARPHAARERMRVQLAVEQGGGPLIGPEDNLGMAVCAFLDEFARRSDGA
jgi:hypothetical protein